MSWHWIDPLRDSRWNDLVERHPLACVFHTRGWLEALKRTYRYEPVVMTTSATGSALADGIVFCRIESWLTGRRLVSLPFSDHCDPLVSSVAAQEDAMQALREEQNRGRWKDVELRPSASMQSSGQFTSVDRYYLHRLNLAVDDDTLWASFHKNHVARKIRRSEREGLVYEEGRSNVLLSAFYGLLLQTRRRHGLPPQPLGWFRAVLDCLNEQAKIRVAFKDRTPVAAIMTLHHGKFDDVQIRRLGRGVPSPGWHALSVLEDHSRSTVLGVCVSGFRAL